MGGTNADRVQWRRARRARRIEAYMVLHGSAPLCACGCGGQVRFDPEGRPRNYIVTHHYSPTEAARAARLAGNIEIGQFRDALQRLRVQKGWQVREMADLAGISRNQMTDLLYSKRRRTVGRDWATMVMRRLAGLPTMATPGQQRRIDRDILLEKQASRETA